MDKFPSTVTTSLGQTLHLAKQIGKGGEGAVFETREHVDIAVKLYWPKNAAARKEKVAAMATAGWAKVNPIVAFPIDVLFGPNGSFAGYVMKKIGGHKPIHLLYSPTSRKVEFQKAQYPFLVRAAQNIAKAVASVHATGCVIGDVNHSGFLVSDAATSVLIDSDSFQVIAANKSFFCQVGTPEYTPAEMQGGKFDRIKRTHNHDNFGLAVLIFQLLFLGKHPFAGRYSGSGDMPLERAIGEFRFAYSSSPNNMQPPPGAPLLSDFSDEIASFFELAFGKTGLTARPSATDWVNALKKLEGALNQCSNDRNHHHVVGRPCPWCRMETQNPGFIAFSSISNITIDPTTVDVAGLLAIIRGVPDPGPPPNIQSVVASPFNPVSTQATIEILSQIKRRAALAIGAAAFGTVLVFFGGSAVLPGWILIGAGIISGFMEPTAIETVRQRRARTEAAYKTIQETWDTQTGNQKFLSLRSESENLVRSLADLPNEQRRSLAELEAKKRELQLVRFLDRFLISDAKIRKIGSARKALMASYGIETAADINLNRVQSIPGFGGSLAANLVVWRDGLARRFVFNPSEPLNSQDVAALKFRLSQKRQDLEKKLRISATALKQASSTSIDQRRKLTQIAEQAFRGLRQAQFDEKEATGPIYLASRIVPFVFAGLAAFVLSSSFPVATSASSRSEIAKAAEKSLPPPVTTMPVPLPAPRANQYGSPSPRGRPNETARPTEANPVRKEPNNSSSVPNTPVPVYPPALSGLTPAVPRATAPPLPPPEVIASLSKSDESAQPAPNSGSATINLLDPSRPSDAIQIQNRLIYWGYLTGIADGKWGLASKRALEEFRSRNGTKSVAAWDAESEQVLFGKDRQVLRPALASFAGAWTDEPGICGEPGEPPPLKLTAQLAQTSSGDTCQFGPLQTIGNNSWQMTAKCKVGGQLRQSNVRLSMNGAMLNWSSENGQATYYRCP